jgi:hypothetical protein
MDLSQLLLTGSISGLISVLAHAVLASAIDLFRRESAPVAVAREELQLADALLHMLCGTGLGLLFWLSWGLAAVVDVPWWVRGGAFGGLCALTLALPAILSIAWKRGMTWRATVAIAARWATTFLLAGLACAWSWQRAA